MVRVCPKWGRPETTNSIRSGTATNLISTRQQGAAVRQDTIELAKVVIGIVGTILMIVIINLGATALTP